MRTDDLLLIAVGGAAAGVARFVIERAATNMRVLILDTDDAVLQSVSPMEGVSATIFGAKRLSGRGTGGDRRLGAGALRDDAALVQSQIGSPRLAILLTCCGGGTSGAVPTLLEMLRNQGIATMTFATMPFSFEGADRQQCATVMMPTIASASDAVARVPLDSLLSEAQLKLPKAEAFAIVAERLAAGLTLLWKLLAQPDFLVFDCERFHRFLSNGSGNGFPCTFADVSFSGPTRAEQALEALVTSPRFSPDGIDRLANASQVIVGVLAGDDFRLSELGTLMDGLRKHCAAAQEVLLGTARDTASPGVLSVVVMAFALPGADVAERPELGLSATAGKRRSSKRSGRSASPLSVVKNRFTDVEQTIVNGQDLDVPTYQRRGIRLSR